MAFFLFALSSSSYANGVPSSSPGLRGTRYLGTRIHTSQPQRGCVAWVGAPANPDGTALRFDIFHACSQGRPHCIRPTLGWRVESRRDKVGPHCIRPILGWRVESRWDRGWRGKGCPRDGLGQDVPATYFRSRRHLLLRFRGRVGWRLLRGLFRRVGLRGSVRWRSSRW